MQRLIASMTPKKISWVGPVKVLVLGLALAGGSGCCGPTALERDYGNAWAYNQTVQIANPEAALEQTPATGLGPNAATTLIGAYNKSFSGKKDGGSSTTINLGTLTTGGGSGGN